MARKKVSLDKAERNPVLDNLPQSSFQDIRKGEQQPRREAGPLPIGVPVSAADLTEQERKDLQSIGWKDGDAVPADLPQAIADMKKEATDLGSMPPPAKPDTPPLQMPDEVDIESLPEEKRKELSSLIEQAGEQYEAAKSAKPNPALETANQQVRNAALGRTDKEITFVDDREEKQSAEATQPQEPATTGEELKLCPHCNWDLSQSDPIIVTEEDKNTFLIATLGGKPWVKTFSLMGDRLQITVRQLKTYELDECYKQAQRLQRDNPEAPMEEFFEQMMRYRICLQLVEVRTDEDIHEFPSELNEWDEASHNALPAIENKIYREVISTDSLGRIFSKVTGEFERLVGKLEVQVENPDFWKEASSPA